MPFCSTPEDVVAFIPRLVETGSDYIKFMVDDGSIEGHPGLPVLDQATLAAGVSAAKAHGMLTVAHTLTVETTRMSIDAGIDGLAHLFMDQPHTSEIVVAIARSGAFVVPCVVLDASMIGIGGGELADDPRVASRLPEEWMNTLRASFGHYPQGDLDDVLGSVKALHDAGVDLLVGTDASFPFPFLGGARTRRERPPRAPVPGPSRVDVPRGAACCDQHHGPPLWPARPWPHRPRTASGPSPRRR